MHSWLDKLPSSHSQWVRQRCPSGALPCLPHAVTASHCDLGLAKASPGGSIALMEYHGLSNQHEEQMMHGAARASSKTTAEEFQGSWEMTQRVKALDAQV